MCHCISKNNLAERARLLRMQSQVFKKKDFSPHLILKNRALKIEDPNNGGGVKLLMAVFSFLLRTYMYAVDSIYGVFAR